MTQIISYSWSLFAQDIKNLADKIGRNNTSGKPKFKGIIAVTRGGLIPAYYLAEELGIKIIKTICIESYTKSRSRMELKYHEADGFTEKIDRVKDWLVVDDIIDTGQTMIYIKKKYPGIKIATLFAKQIRPDYWVRNANGWVRFPWERD